MCSPRESSIVEPEKGYRLHSESPELRSGLCDPEKLLSLSERWVIHLLKGTVLPSCRVAGSSGASSPEQGLFVAMFNRSPSLCRL